MKRLLSAFIGCALIGAAGTPLFAAPTPVSITEWKWIAAGRSRAGAPDTTSPNTNEAGWKDAAIGADIFHGRIGCAWFRAELPASASTPKRIHFESVDDNAAVYLNGRHLLYHEIWNEPFDVPIGAAWKRGGPNVLLVLVQNTAGAGGILGPVREEFDDRPQLLGGNFTATLDPATGGLTEIRNSADQSAMNWVHARSTWGVGWLRAGEQRLDWQLIAPLRRGANGAWIAEYQAGDLRIMVARSVTPQGRLNETYTIVNRGTKPLTLPEGTVGIRTPLNDTYAGGAAVAIARRCNAHIWCGGTSAYLCATRMGGAAPHLGLVLTHGSVTGYSLDGATGSDERGLISLNPAATTLAPGQRRVISWTMFWHRGWGDFFAKTAAIPAFTRLETTRYTLTLGENAIITAHGAPRGARLSVDGRALAPVRTPRGLRWVYRTAALGEHVAHLTGNGTDTILRLLVTPPPMDLIRSRVLFIVRHQQRNAPGTPLDGAYLIYDNGTGKQIYETAGDHNAGRERVGMGCLVARYLLECRDPAAKKELRASLDRYYAFVNRELTDDNGVVYGDVGRRDPGRLYNYPWVAELHVLMYRVTRDPACLRRFARVIHTLYGRDGYGFYCIGLPISEGLAQLKAAEMTVEYRAVLAEFVKHADRLAANGIHVPSSEVSYEQSIVAPAVQILWEVYHVTHGPQYRQAAESLYPLMVSFNGRQPDYHLNDIAIRHWDDYWFGKSRQYGDTFPHYWSTITAVALHDRALATGGKGDQKRAEQIVSANLCLFRLGGQASCAYVYPTMIDGARGRFFDAWANDQDWALDNYLIVMRGHSAPAR